MTKRYSVEQVSDMLRCSFEDVRTALAGLEAGKALSAETFCFAGKSWRIAPSDVAKIQDAVVRRLKEGREAGPTAEPPPGTPQSQGRVRRVVRRVPGGGP